jgi:hypothetical protein
MATVAPYFRYFFTDATGAPLVGGKVYTYGSGGTTPQITYTNSSESTPNANPIILGARGEADIWLVAAVGYRFDVYDASDVLQYTVDNVTSFGNMAFQEPGNVGITGGSITGVNITLTDASTILGQPIGYRTAPQISSNVTYTLVLTDSGKHVRLTTGGTAVNIPANSSVAFPIGTAITVVNETAANCSITITTDTLRLAATASTGTRTLAAYGVCTLFKVDSALWFVFGAGVS